ncbi:FeoA family protein [Cellulomonas fimi]|uniref:FeoA family protein n=1 Tax=Cellulomonas fimi (strain ATCC 484 / DSM 20113 / JCM 1341 / CCUG 24087 / LMG 16345 / NBRC 15513 / NCIMB 8980 / NCTC 7547 / NRS-133) TaxID=590998 RepID=F4H2S0_CELFA|nr:FeoA family protein [Cellulomonas fimi]AEE46419.1 FeoA family protein [Cellulomonas fimi ATCC 484]NNH08709.1 ferrous iron transport protein A [Cellulomonas fimi]VEH32921.1 FeoA domain [Cellulomonas fimi]
MDLTGAPTRSLLRVVHLGVDGRAGLRLRELGLRPGAVVEVTHDARAQGRVVAVGAERFALDRHTCTRIAVEPA